MALSGKVVNKFSIEKTNVSLAGACLHKSTMHAFFSLKKTYKNITEMTIFSPYSGGNKHKKKETS